MSRWFRHYAGMMRDDKLVRAALVSKQPVERVVWVWGAILESAAEIDDGGRYDVDAAEIAYFLRADEVDIRAILDALGAMGRLAGGSVVKWGDRQFLSDRSGASRQAAFRERKRAESNVGGDHDAATERDSNSRVTSPSRHSNAPETETETETETEKRERARSAPRSPRGSRLSADWQPKPAEIALAEQLLGSRAEITLAKFRDYWAAKAGAGGVKADWDATWRNWIRREAEDSNGRQQNHRTGTPTGRGSLPSHPVGWPERSVPSKLSRAAEWLTDGGSWPPDVKPSDIDKRGAVVLRDSLVSSLNGATPQTVITMLTQLMLHYPRPDFTDGQARQVCMDMAQDFAGVPSDIMAETCREWRRTEKWFPRTSELLAKANAMVEARKRALRDVRRVLDAIDKPAPPKGDNFTALDIDTEEARIKQFLAGLSERANAERGVPGPSDYANQLRPWQRPGWKPSADAPKLDMPETKEPTP